MLQLLVWKKQQNTKEQKKILEDLKSGKVDIIVGTHKILGKEVDFKNLGLLVIDEEQRFGVAHKEKIKQLKTNIDVLTLTATPIPRTLHMSLIGIRDMSVLEEAPNDRMPIQTYVMEYNADATGAKYRDIAKAMGVENTENMTEAEYRKAAVEAVKALSQKVGIPQKLHEVGVKEEDLPALARDAFNDVCTGGNPKDTSIEEILEIYKTAF